MTEISQCPHCPSPPECACPNGPPICRVGGACVCDPEVCPCPGHVENVPEDVPPPPPDPPEGEPEIEIGDPWQEEGPPPRQIVGGPSELVTEEKPPWWKQPIWWVVLLIVLLFVVLLIVLLSSGSDSDDSSAVVAPDTAAPPTEAPAPTEAPTPTEAPAPTDAPPPTEAPVETEAPTTVAETTTTVEATVPASTLPAGPISLFDLFPPFAEFTPADVVQQPGGVNPLPPDEFIAPYGIFGTAVYGNITPGTESTLLTSSSSTELISDPNAIGISVSDLGTPNPDVGYQVVVYGGPELVVNEPQPDDTEPLDRIEGVEKMWVVDLVGLNLIALDPANEFRETETGATGTVSDERINVFVPWSELDGWNIAVTTFGRTINDPQTAEDPAGFGLAADVISVPRFDAFELDPEIVQSDVESFVVSVP